MDSVKSQDDKECVVRFAYILQKLNRCEIPEFSAYSRFLDFFQTARDNNYRRSRKKKKKKKKEVLRHRACNALAMTHPTTARAHAYVLYTLVRSYNRCPEIYTLRHDDTAVPRKEHLARSIDVSLITLNINSIILRSRVRTIAMRRAST